MLLKTSLAVDNHSKIQNLVRASRENILGYAQNGVWLFRVGLTTHNIRRCIYVELAIIDLLKS